MFAKLGATVVRHPWWTIIAWLAVTVVIAASAPALSATADQVDFLPDHYESVQAQSLASEAFPEVVAPAGLLVFAAEGGGPLTSADEQQARGIVRALGANVYPDMAPLQEESVQVAPNREILLAVVDPSDGSAAVRDGEKLTSSITALREDARPMLAGIGVTMGVTGDAAQRLDAQNAAGDVDQRVLLATLALITILMLVMFQSILLAVLPIVMILLATVVSSGLIGFASQAFGLQADQSIQSLLVVVLFGVGSDYFLFLVFRYRENLRAGLPADLAMSAAVGRVGEAITSAAGAVIVAFLALTLSTLGQLRAYGPSLAIAVAVTLAVSLTLAPAVITLCGKKVFWPSRSFQRPARQRFAGGAGRLVGRRPGLVAGAATLTMAALALFAFGFTPQFDQSASGPQDLESVVAQRSLERGFSAGASQPTDIIVTSQDGRRLQPEELAAYGRALTAVDGVGTVAGVTPNEAGDTAAISVLLADTPTSKAGIATAGGELRVVAHREAPAGTIAYVGGLSSVLADVQTAVNRDYKVVFPVAGVAILLILALLLRSAVAPWYLMGSVALGFGAALGAAVLVFQQLRGQDGLLFTLPILMYLFVVAIGTDYNILMVARIREEVQQGLAPRAAAGLAVRHTASTIAAGGVILGGTFAVLTAANDAALQQMGVGISVGIFVVAFIMAIFLTPALTALFGARAFWPGNRARIDQPTSGHGSAADREALTVTH